MSDKHDLLEYAFSKKLCEDLPKAKIILEKFKEELQPYNFFVDCHKVLHQVDDALISIDLHLGVYGIVKDKKGLINEPK